MIAFLVSAGLAEILDSQASLKILQSITSIPDNGTRYEFTIDDSNIVEMVQLLDGIPFETDLHVYWSEETGDVKKHRAVKILQNMKLSLRQRLKIHVYCKEKFCRSPFFPDTVDSIDNLEITESSDLHLIRGSIQLDGLDSLCIDSLEKINNYPHLKIEIRGLQTISEISSEVSISERYKNFYLNMSNRIKFSLRLSNFADSQSLMEYSGFYSKFLPNIEYILIDEVPKSLVSAVSRILTEFLNPVEMYIAVPVALDMSRFTRLKNVRFIGEETLRLNIPRVNKKFGNLSINNTYEFHTGSEYMQNLKFANQVFFMGKTLHIENLEAVEEAVDWRFISQNARDVYLHQETELFRGSSLFVEIWSDCMIHTNQATMALNAKHLTLELGRRETPASLLKYKLPNELSLKLIVAGNLEMRDFNAIKWGGLIEVGIVRKLEIIADGVTDIETVIMDYWTQVTIRVTRGLLDCSAILVVGGDCLEKSDPNSSVVVLRKLL
jgi:hypothetical protein